MLEEIIDSKPKTSVLAILLASPRRGFAPKELAGKAHITLKTLEPVLKYFLKISLIESYSRGKVKFYILNARHKLLPEIQSSVLKNQKKYEDELHVALKKLGDLEGIYLTGIFTGLPYAPVDMLLVGKANLNKLAKFLENAKKALGLEINYSLMPTEEFTLRRDTFDRFLKDIFDYPHLVVLDKTTKTAKKGSKSKSK